jgi:hypothetical protein
VFGLGCYDLRSIPFGSPANLFLSGKAEMAVKTRHDCAVFLKPRRRRADYAAGTDEALAKTSASPEKNLRNTVCAANRSATTDSAYGGF